MENINIVDRIREKCRSERSSNGSCFYFLGMIGAAVHFIGSATSFWMGIIGTLKAFIWPAILVYKAFENLS